MVASRSSVEAELIELQIFQGTGAETPRQNTNAGSRSSSTTRGQITTALVVACENRDVSMVELLLKNEARDDEAKALSVAIKNGDDILITKLLSIKVIIICSVRALIIFLVSPLIYRHRRRMLTRSTK